MSAKTSKGDEMKCKTRKGNSKKVVSHSVLRTIPERLRSFGGEFFDVATRIEALVNAQENEFRIVVAGAMNPGKSTLLNALLKNPDVFKTADIRETTAVRSVLWKDNILLVDTPGFGSSVYEDDGEAMSALRQADLVLFVHNIALGGINKSELDALTDIEAVFETDEFKKRVLFVNTRSDECADEDLRKNEKECKDLIQENLGCMLATYTVSAKMYLDGVKTVESGNENDGKILMNEGKVAGFSRALTQKIKKEGSRQNGEYAKVIAELENKMTELKLRCSQKREKIKSESAEIRADWAKVLSEVRPFWTECSKN